MTDRRDPLLANQTHDVAASCGRRLLALCGHAVVMLVLSLLVDSPANSRVLAEDEDGEEVVVLGARQIVFTEQQFDQMVFGGQQAVQRAVVVRRANGVQAVEVVQNMVVQNSVTDFRKRMESTAAAEIEAVDRRVSLTEAQKKKLSLAARGDVSQLVSRAAELRSKLTSKPMNQQQYTELMRELQPLRMSQQFGVIGENSLFRKTLRHTLTGEQRVRWQTLERERQSAVIETAIQTWERMANGVKMPAPNRQKFIDVLVEYGNLPETRSTYIYYVVLVEAGKLEDRLKPILSEEIWEKLQIQITQAKQVEATLRRSGQWPVRSAEDDEGLADQAKE